MYVLTHISIWTCIWICKRTHIHKCIYIYMHTCIRAHMHTCDTCTFILSNMPTYMCQKTFLDLHHPLSFFLLPPRWAMYMRTHAYAYICIHTCTCIPTHPHTVQFSSFLSPIGARTLKIPVPYSPPSVGAYTRTPSHQPLVFGRKGTDHLP